jgi:hypothetical protein
MAAMFGSTLWFMIWVLGARGVVGMLFSSAFGYPGVNASYDYVGKSDIASWEFSLLIGH